MKRRSFISGVAALAVARVLPPLDAFASPQVFDLPSAAIEKVPLLEPLNWPQAAFSTPTTFAIEKSLTPRTILIEHLTVGPFRWMFCGLSSKHPLHIKLRHIEHGKPAKLLGEGPHFMFGSYSDPMQLYEPYEFPAGSELGIWLHNWIDQPNHVHLTFFGMSEQASVSSVVEK